jgi:plasmid stability protein
VRTTLTLDEDVAAKLKSRARRLGRPFKDEVNAALRRGLAVADQATGRSRFVVKARDLGALRSGLSLDNVGALLDLIEGAGHR